MIAYDTAESGEELEIDEILTWFSTKNKCYNIRIFENDHIYNLKYLGWSYVFSKNEFKNL